MGERDIDDIEERESKRERKRCTLPRSPALLQLAVVVYQPPRCNLIRALSHERTESARWTPLAFSTSSFSSIHGLLSVPPSLSLSLFSLILSIRLNVGYRAMYATCYTTLSSQTAARNPKLLETTSPIGKDLLEFLILQQYTQTKVEYCNTRLIEVSI